MELLLNLAWLLLAIPAYQLWRNSTPANRRRGFSSLQCLLALGCALVLLFPVISATDDLHAMRAEMEESPASKRSIRQAGNEKGPNPQTTLQSPPALLSSVPSFLLTTDFGIAIFYQASMLPEAPSLLNAGRAPPAHPFV
jgi:hypothetical protein